jgi:hypothetical protein
MRTLGEWYLSESGGDVVRYHQGLKAGHRIGQAFFNALSSADKERVRGTIWDTFYSNRLDPDVIEHLVMTCDD